MNDVDRNTLQSMAEHLKRYSDGGQHQHIPGPSAGACWDYAKEIELVLSRCRKTSLESDSEWYERERASFIVWWESEGEKKFGATPTMAAGAGWFARAEAACGEADQRDAARYRWLRDNAYAEQVEYDSWYLSFDMPTAQWRDSPGTVTRDMCDAAIDAAMQPGDEER